MDHLNLVVKFQVAGDNQVQVKAATRIKVDGRGGLIVYDGRGGFPEFVEIGRLENLSLHPLAGAQENPRALVA